MGQPWPPGTEPGQPDAELGTVKPDGYELARHWPDGPPGHDYWQPPGGGGVDPGPLPPVASFFYTPPAPATQDNVTFDGTGSHPGDAPISTYAWLFNNSATRSGPVVSWRLPSGSGSYPATLTVTDGNGLTGTATQVLTI
jgi:hypothetical protein